MLQEKFDLSSKYEVGLKAISYTKSWYNVHNDVKKQLMLPNKIREIEKDSVTLKSGYYDNVSNMVSLLNEKTNLTFFGSLSYDNNTKCVTLNPAEIKEGDKVEYGYPTYGEEMDQMLGIYEITSAIKEIYSVNSVIPLNTYRGKSFHLACGQLTLKIGHPITSIMPVDISAGYHSLYVYCDLIVPGAVGNTRNKLLRLVEIPSKVDFNDQVAITYDEPLFKPLLRHSFDTVEIDIKDDTNLTMDEVLEYYRNQAGSGLSGFAGTRYQRGNGLFSNLWTKIGLPVLKFLGRQAISTGLNVASDALDGRNLKEAAVDHLKTSGRNTVNYLKQLNQQSGRGVKRRKATKRKAIKKRKTRRKSAVVKKQPKKKRRRKRSTKNLSFF
ncbi:uncharacterized protein B4U80_03439 [Leptotrombidium deliense]|uniref:Uncharacterized protein n=1 Tax=Leptotrombidium deliense TaxID=299467 RepID=A0A443RZ84_9ACAR|nr:uncharacterized protein B4U80_03439 [Leptotrombidium deliense]